MIEIGHYSEKHKLEAAIQCVKLLGQKNPENVECLGDGLFSHTNTRGKTRLFFPCLTYKEYDKKQKEYPDARMHKCIGYYVLYWNK